MATRLDDALGAVGRAFRSDGRFHDVLRSRAFHDLIEAIRTDRRIAPVLDRPVGIGFGGQRLTADAIANRCLRILQADPSGVRALRETFDATFPAEMLLVELSLPLRHFDGPDRLAIADGLELVRVAPSGDETHVLRRTLRLPTVLDEDRPLRSSLAIHAAAHDDLWIAMHALHLVAPGACDGAWIVEDVGGPLLGGRSRKSQGGTRLLATAPATPFVLSRAQATEAVEVIRQCLTTPARQLLRVPLRRLHQSLGRVPREERLDDLMIALQALLTPEYDTELSLRFAVRGAAVLGATIEERHDIFLRLHAAYRERHDRVPDGSADRWPAPLDVLTDDLRRTLRFCAERIATTSEPLTSFIPALEIGLVG